MTLDLLRIARSMTLSLALACPAFVAGCAVDQASDEAETAEDYEGATTDEVTEVSHTKVKRQSIGNCWLYATMSWAEALNKSVDGAEVNLSESYLTYWDWFEKIANGSGTTDSLQTGGSYATAAELVHRYGLMLEKDFIPAEADAEMSAAQKKALDTINLSLKSGALKDSSSRKNKSLVRAELNRAFGLEPAVVTDLDAVFGKSVTRTLDKSFSGTKKMPTGTKVIRPLDFKVKLRSTATGSLETRSLQDAVGKKGGWWGERQGAFAWNEAEYPYSSSERRKFWVRVQRALHDKQPVIISWFVDFNALTSDAKFSKAALDKAGPGRQGGHMTVLHDYQVKLPDGTLLEAGKTVTDPALLTKALDEKSQIEFMRIKNSWGAYRPDRWQDAVLPGYHDLMWDYLNGPVQKCGEDAAGNTDTKNCQAGYTPMWDVVLPPGY